MEDATRSKLSHAGNSYIMSLDKAIDEAEQELQTLKVAREAAQRQMNHRPAAITFNPTPTPPGTPTPLRQRTQLGKAMDAVARAEAEDTELIEAVKNAI